MCVVLITCKRVNVHNAVSSGREGEESQEFERNPKCTLVLSNNEQASTSVYLVTLSKLKLLIRRR